MMGFISDIGNFFCNVLVLLLLVIIEVLFLVCEKNLGICLYNLMGVMWCFGEMYCMFYVYSC